MGLFCANLHFRTADEEALSAALDERGVTQYCVLPAKRGWVSLYEQRMSQQDDERIRELASELTADLHVAAIALLVHDSDVACYWLFDNGQLLDQYNSCPDYFDDEALSDGPQSSGGQPDVLVRFCRAGVRQDELGAILADEPLFAEAIIERLADVLEIDRERALSDYSDVAGDDGPHGMDEFDADNDDPSAGLGGADLTSRVAAMLGFDPHGPAADPQAVALVQAAARGDTDKIAQLLADGVAIDVEALAPLPENQAMPGLGQIFAAKVPQIAMTPLLAAVVNKQRAAAELLLDAGADPNRVHQLFGTAVHAATGAGDVELLRLLIDHGGDVNAQNAQLQTPLQGVTADRATRERLVQAQAMMKSMGVKIPGLIDQLSNITLPTVGWDACERLLKSHGAR